MGGIVATARLSEVEITPWTGPLPDTVAALVADANRRIEQFDEEFQASIPAFVPSDFDAAYRMLTSVRDSHAATGRRLVEWGSGLGAVTCLAAELGFDAVGIEIEPSLIQIARSLASDHGVDVQFVCGSYVPSGAEPFVDTAGEVTWLRTDRPDCYAEIGLDPEDFDVIYAYPWPGEEQVIFDLFENCAATGTLLLTFHGQDGLRVQRKVRR
jgi:Methyltransferase domain